MMGPTFPYMEGGIFNMVTEAFIYGVTLGFMFGMIFVVICWIWLDGRLPKEKEE